MPLQKLTISEHISNIIIKVFFQQATMDSIISLIYTAHMNKKKLLIIVAAITAAVTAAWWTYNTRGVIIYAEDQSKTKIVENSSLAHSCVFVWSANCSACVYSLPHINILQQHIELAGGKLILVLEDDNIFLLKLAKAHFIRLNTPNLKTYYDKQHSLQKRYKLTSFPTLLVFNSKGKLVHKVEGFVPWSEEKKINEILLMIKS